MATKLIRSARLDLGRVISRFNGQLLEPKSPGIQADNLNCRQRQKGLTPDSLVPLEIKNDKVVSSRPASDDERNLPLMELAKNEKIVDYGFPELGKISLAVHDAFDHMLTLKMLNEHGLLDDSNGRGYKQFLDVLGNFHNTDIFNRESELLASVAYDVRSFSVMPRGYEPSMTLQNLVENFQLSPSLANSKNQQEALGYLQRIMETDPKGHDANLIRHVVSSMGPELREQTRKTNRTLFPGPENDPASRITMGNPEYLALIVDTVRLLDSAKGREAVAAYNLKVEDYLQGLAQGADSSKPFKWNVAEPVTETHSLNAPNVPEAVKSWLLEHPGCITRRSAIRDSAESALEAPPRQVLEGHEKETFRLIEPDTRKPLMDVLERSQLGKLAVGASECVNDVLKMIERTNPKLAAELLNENVTTGSNGMGKGEKGAIKVLVAMPGHEDVTMKLSELLKSSDRPLDYRNAVHELVGHRAFDTWMKEDPARKQIYDLIKADYRERQLQPILTSREQMGHLYDEACAKYYRSPQELAAETIATLAVSQKLEQQLSELQRSGQTTPRELLEEQSRIREYQTRLAEAWEGAKPVKSTPEKEQAFKEYFKYLDQFASTT